MANVVFQRLQGIEFILLVNKPHRYSQHNHMSVFTIGLVLDGNVFLQTNNTATRYEKLSYFIIRPLVPHTLLLPDSYRLLTICIEQDYLMAHTASEIYLKLLCNLKPFGRIDNTLLKNAIHALYPVMPCAKTRDDMLNSAIFIRNNPERDIGIQEMADAVHSSKYHFLRVFKRALGITPHRFQLQSRIRKAQRLIEKGTSLTDVAFATGFFDQSHFIKCFKKTVGFTPTEYKKSCQRR